MLPVLLFLYLYLYSCTLYAYTLYIVHCTTYYIHLLTANAILYAYQISVSVMLTKLTTGVYYLMSDLRFDYSVFTTDSN